MFFGVFFFLPHKYINYMVKTTLPKNCSFSFFLHMTLISVVGQPALLLHCQSWIMHFPNYFVVLLLNFCLIKAVCFSHSLCGLSIWQHVVGEFSSPYAQQLRLSLAVQPSSAPISTNRHVSKVAFLF